MDLCSGGGGFILAEAISQQAKNALRLETVVVCDNNENCQDVLRLRFPHIPVIPDIFDVTTKSLRQLGIPKIDGICGGFPCQPHSVAGKKKGSKDERDLWPEIRRILREVQPRWAVFENVPGLFRTDAGRFLRGIFGDLAQLGFDVEWGVISCAYMEASPNEFIGAGGVHLRERVWIVAYRHLQGEGAATNHQNPDPYPNGIRCHNGGGLQREYEDLFHKKWDAKEDQQPRGKWVSGVKSLCPADDPTSREQMPQSLPFGGDDGLPPNLGGYLLRHPDLEGWLTASTIPCFFRQVRCSIELTPGEIRSLSPEDRSEYQKLKRAFDKEFNRQAECLEGEGANQYCQFQEQFLLKLNEYKELKKAINTQLSIFGNAIVPHVGAIAFAVLKERLSALKEEK
jgi:DNA-cytosine methyltransferase